LVVQRDFIVNLSKLGPDGTPIPLPIANAATRPGEGLLMNRAFEGAAAQLAKQSGATSVRVEVGFVQNARWAARLAKEGYIEGVKTPRPGLFGGAALVKLLKIK